MKKTTQKTTTKNQKLWIGIGVIAVVAVALIFGLGALSIQPTETTGPATVYIYTRDGTQLNASETVTLYRCDYTNVTPAEFDEFVSTFSNYESVEINSSNTDGLTLKLTIKENEIYMLKIMGSTYFNEWFQVFAGDNRFVISEKPDSAGLSRSVMKMNSSHISGISYLTLYSVDTDLVANKNCSIPAQIYDLETNITKTLYLKLDKSADYTAAVFNLTGCTTHLHNGDLYISLPGLNSYSTFDFIFELAEMGSPALYLVYATAGFANVQEIVDVSQY